MVIDNRHRSATQSDVAKEVGVSRTLVSFAFRGAPGVSEETKQAIFDAAKRLGYRPNAVAADLARKHRSAVGLHLLDIRNEVYADILSGVRMALPPQDGNRLILSVSRSVDGEDHGALESLIEARVGIIIAATLLDSDERVHELAKIVPLVSVTRPVDGVDSVYSDDAAGARAATEHLIRLGHTRIAHLAGPPVYDGHTVRRQSYAQTMRDAGLKPLLLEADDFTQDAGQRAAAKLLAMTDRPTAIFTHNDPLALAPARLRTHRAFRCRRSFPWWDTTTRGPPDFTASTSHPLTSMLLNSGGLREPLPWNASAIPMGPPQTAPHTAARGAKLDSPASWKQSYR